ncbi:alkylhydroperoxidase [Pollutimonas nitritireducens]|uniref:Alkylhydroperoxidase n=1 Tax=Pollutimonas nitritireducens TaxID=2045209 RepID=A0A2N4UDY6_9BURK|nr:carboxymuconolactone decarboxylase family protein [Pollutimonas nitritireducens]PLC53226.1 alkylhydroperoxidase [Pollutimonas nitritireducens]
MQVRLDFPKAAPDAYRAVAELDRYVREESGLDHQLLHLIKLRASQINGCAYCVDMHVKEARRDGLSEQWINLVSVWQESPVFTPRERAVLAWTEALTNLAQTRAPDADFEPLRDFFSEAEMTKLTVAIGTINVWNRLAVGFRSQHPVDTTRKAA